MKLDDGPVLLCPSLPRKSYNPFDSDDDPLDSPATRADNVLTIDDPIHFGMESFDRSIDTLPFHVNGVDLPWGEPILVHPSVVESAMKVDGIDNNGLLEKGIEFCTDKDVVEFVSPDLVVGFKEGSYQSVKDICIDDGVPSQGKTWAETKEHVGKDLFDLLDFGSYDNGDSYKHVEDSHLADHERLNSSAENGCPIDEGAEGLAKMAGPDIQQVSTVLDSLDHSDAETRFSAGERVMGGRVDGAAESAGNGPAESNHDLVSEARLNRDTTSDDGREVSEILAAADTHEVQTKDLVPSLRMPSVSGGMEAEIRIAESHNEEAMPSTSSEPSELPELVDGATSSMSSSPPVYVIDSASAAVVSNSLDYGKEAGKTTQLDVRPPISQTMTRDRIAYVEPDQRCHGETSFSAGMHPPSSITFMGQLAYSGSASLRSESSIGSARSFAFPVLQTEWHGSPVRMTKADQKQQKGWLESVVCCRF
ncbi:hypothetical protein Droror1_Dr00008283 [Drosera rotundifolia]